MPFLFHFLLTKQSVEFCKTHKIVKVVIVSTIFIVHMVWEGFNSARLFFTPVWFGFRRDVVVVSFFLVIGILSLHDSLLRALLHLQYFPIEWRHWNNMHLKMLTTSMTLWNVFHSSRESPGQHLCTNLREKRGWVVAGGRTHETLGENLFSLWPTPIWPGLLSNQKVVKIENANLSSLVSVMRCNAGLASAGICFNHKCGALGKTSGYVDIHRKKQLLLGYETKQPWSTYFGFCPRVRMPILATT